jgi:ribonuclease D
LDKKLCEVFSNESSTIVGFAFKSDVEMFARRFPKMQFYRYAKNFIDAQTYYAEVCPVTGAQTSLAKVSEHIFGKPICKSVQMSNWEKRPLKLAQQHYAALDAYILVRLIRKLAEAGLECGKPLEGYIKELDKRDLKIADADVSDEEEINLKDKI